MKVVNLVKLFTQVVQKISCWEADFAHMWSSCDPDLWSPNLFSSSVSQVDESCKCDKIPSLYSRYCVHKLLSCMHARTAWKHDASGSLSLGRGIQNYEDVVATYPAKKKYPRLL